MTDTPAPPPGTRRAPLIGATLLLLAVALVALLAVRGSSLKSRLDLGAERSAAMDAAREEVLALTSVSAGGGDGQLKRIRNGATADFREQFEQQARAFQKSLSDAKVTSTGRIESAGVVTIEPDSAEVLVAAVAAIRNKKMEAAQQRSYRLRVSLEKVSGTWLVSSMDFVA